MKIYVCGGSSEMDLVAGYMSSLRAMGHVITEDWISAIRVVGESNPRQITHRRRMRYASDDLRGIRTAALVWVILPVAKSFGCAFEMGFAVGRGHEVIISGDWRETIFSSMADFRFDEHEHALEWIRLLGSRGNQEEAMLALEAE